MIRNTVSSYGLVAIIIHWLMAVSIFFLFGLGLYMVELSYYDSWYKGSLDLHKSIGVCLLLALIFRVIWRTINIVPQPEVSGRKGEAFEHKVAHLVHLMLYILMFLIMSSGYLISTADGRGVGVFELFDVPALPSLIENQEDIAGEIHFYLAWTLIVLVILHVAGALKHHFIDKDTTLVKMLRSGK
ncbi:MULTISPECIES: cytochrome b [unclassified Oleiphilus]|nr:MULTISPECIES: cytochrome b [unclassified Oleiphilus]KZY50938.1 cytochrome B [Oleiphilus sp. HI0050]KZY87914.1 cytochrome B [Oleiphilus sp. HI0072]KZZ21287.1 cytochrome B [Oleiphilus sp. HI0078]KZZ22408.1 cytochrome B [Oleiphilus sp. HI0081]KZY28266.1 cytochrome B [Oleiphilus sp. HI0043]